MEFMTEGDVNVLVTIVEDGDDLTFTFHVVQPGEEGYTGQIGELNGVFFDLANSAADSVTTVTDADGNPRHYETGDESISNLGGSVNMNGAILIEDGKYDIGILTEETGLGNGDTQDFTFTVSAEGGLSYDEVVGMDFGLRLTSVGDPDGAREGSLKLSGVADPEEPENPEAPLDPENPGNPEETNAINTAIDDHIIVVETAVFEGIADWMIGGYDSILDNDLTETETDPEPTPYEGEVTQVEGDDMEEPRIIVPGSNGGLLIVSPDGTVDFDADGQFDSLGEDDRAETTFEYMIEGGSTATVTVQIYGLDDGGGTGEPAPEEEFLF